MFRPARGDVRFPDPIVRFQRVHVVFAEVTGVGRQRTDLFFHADGVQVLERLRHHRIDFLRIVRLIGDVGRDENLIFIGNRYADCEKVTVVCDNLNTHTKGAFYEAFEPEQARRLVRRIEFCYTPKHGSWLNIAENELSSLTRQCVAGRRIGDIKTLREETEAWSVDVNSTQRGVDWQMKIDDARCKLKSVYPKIMA
jgi:hypothetical protein